MTFHAVDIFCGAGGWSHGWRTATGTEPMLGVNHCAHAVHLHRLNHPATEHHLKDVWEVDPTTALAGRRVDWLHGSPDCTHHSRAKGGKPREQKIRALADVLIEWCRVGLPSVFSLENVAEWLDWGPLDEAGHPIKARKGELFREWLGKLQALGYVAEWRVLCAADYGAPTIRKRLFLIARRDGQPIAWPAPTHADPKILYGTSSEDAAERHRDQSSARRRKAARGPADGGGLCDGVEEAGQADRGPEQARVSADLHHDARQGHLFDDAPGRLDRGARSAGDRAADQPQGRQEGEQRTEQPGACDASSEQRARPSHGPVEAGFGPRERVRETERGAGDGSAPDESQRRVDSGDRGVLRSQRGLHEADRQRVGAGLFPWLTAASCIDWSIPVRSIFDRKKPLAPATCRRIAAGIVRFVLQGKPFIVTCNHGKEGFRGQGLDAPMNTVTASHDANGVVVPTLIQTAHGDFAERAGVRAHQADAPLGVVTGSNNHALVAAFLQQNFTGMVGKPLRVPVPTITARDHHSLVAATLLANNSNNAPGRADVPLGTITTGDRHYLVASFLTTYYGQGGTANGVDRPLPAVVTRARHGLVTVTIDGTEFVVADIGLRMLEPRELARAQGFPDSYVLQGTKAQQIARIGNSVCPDVAAAIVAANIGREAAVA